MAILSWSKRFLAAFVLGSILIGFALLACGIPINEVVPLLEGGDEGGTSSSVPVGDLHSVTPVRRVGDNKYAYPVGSPGVLGNVAIWTDGGGLSSASPGTPGACVLWLDAGGLGSAACGVLDGAVPVFSPGGDLYGSASQQYVEQITGDAGSVSIANTGQNLAWTQDAAPMLSQPGTAATNQVPNNIVLAPQAPNANPNTPEAGSPGVVEVIAYPITSDAGTGNVMGGITVVIPDGGFDGGPLEVARMGPLNNGSANGCLWLGLNSFGTTGPSWRQAPTFQNQTLCGLGGTTALYAQNNLYVSIGTYLQGGITVWPAASGTIPAGLELNNIAASSAQFSVSPTTLNSGLVHIQRNGDTATTPFTIAAQGAFPSGGSANKNGAALQLQSGAASVVESHGVAGAVRIQLANLTTQTIFEATEPTIGMRGIVLGQIGSGILSTDVTNGDGWTMFAKAHTDVTTCGTAAMCWGEHTTGALWCCDPGGSPYQLSAAVGGALVGDTNGPLGANTVEKIWNTGVSSNVSSATTGNGIYWNESAGSEWGAGPLVLDSAGGVTHVLPASNGGVPTTSGITVGWVLTNTTPGSPATWQASSGGGGGGGCTTSIGAMLGDLVIGSPAGCGSSVTSDVVSITGSGGVVNMIASEQLYAGAGAYQIISNTGISIGAGGGGSGNLNLSTSGSGAFALLQSTSGSADVFGTNVDIAATGSTTTITSNTSTSITAGTSVTISGPSAATLESTTGTAELFSSSGQVLAQGHTDATFQSVTGTATLEGVAATVTSTTATALLQSTNASATVTAPNGTIFISASGSGTTGLTTAGDPVRLGILGSYFLDITGLTASSGVRFTQANVEGGSRAQQGYITVNICAASLPGPGAGHACSDYDLAIYSPH